MAAALLILLALTSSRYGWHRDELYFVVAGRHPAWGYPDQPLLTPLLSAGLDRLGGGSLVVLRLSSALASAATVVLVGVIAGLLGGTDRARRLASAMWAAGAVSLITGHLVSTATFDVLFTTAFAACVLKATATGRAGWMLAAGAVLGAGLLNKLVVGIAAALIVAALLVLGPRRPLLSGPALAGGVLAVLGALPYVRWQNAHGWPQSQVARSIAGQGNRIGVLPLQLFLVSVLLAPFLIAGLVHLLRHRARALGYAYLAMLVLTIATGGKAYYAAGLLTVLTAAAGVVADGWLGRGRVRLRTALTGVAVGVSLVLDGLSGLAVTPAAQLSSSGIESTNHEAGEQVGWPEFRDAVRAAVRTLPPEQRGRAVVFSSNYSEAGAVILGRDLPPAYSGQNGFAFWPPPATATGPVILTGFDPGDPALRYFTGCRVTGRVDNGYGLDNDEQGAVLQVCDGPAGGWTAVWPSLIHFD